MGEGTTWWESAKTPLFKVDESVSDPASTATEPQEVATPTKPLATPSIVHYRPNGIPSVRNRRPSTCDPQKRKSKSDPQNDSKIRMVKWDRVTDKGTAPLNVEPRHPTQRSCTLCYLIKKKVVPEPSILTDESVSEQMANVRMKHILVQHARRTTLSVNLFRLLNFVKERLSLRV
jgi:hypothetical protein